MNEVALLEQHKGLFKLEASMKKLPQTETPVAHDFCKGLYARTIFIPSGTLVVGAIHKDESFFLVRSGALVIVADNTEPTYLSAGYMGVTKALTKRAVVALTDVTFTTFHANPDELRDTNAIWDHFTIPPPEETLEQTKRQELEA